MVVNIQRSQIRNQQPIIITLIDRSKHLGKLLFVDNNKWFIIHNISVISTISVHKSPEFKYGTIEKAHAEYSRTAVYFDHPELWDIKLLNVIEVW